jgi:2-C-methyl-D-erythritol 4-phosphate cytidylyltransferase
MGSDIPKQYLLLDGRSVIEHSLAVLCRHPRIAGVVVATAPDDRWWRTPSSDLTTVPRTVAGGEQRQHSVLNGLRGLAGAGRDDWVLVHDAARPCLTRGDVDRLIDTLHDHPVGGLLGVPVADTVKRTDRHGNIVETVERVGLWRAMTPQMFRFGMLAAALEAALSSRETVTDEAAAMERMGHRPLMVEGRADNIKITHQQDLALAALYLQQQVDL